MDKHTHFITISVEHDFIWQIPVAIDEKKYKKGGGGGGGGGGQGA